MSYSVYRPIIETVKEEKTTYSEKKKKLITRKTTRSVLKGHELVHTADTYDECWIYVLKNQSSSVDFALKHKGWKIEENK